MDKGQLSSENKKIKAEIALIFENLQAQGYASGSVGNNIDGLKAICTENIALKE